MAEEHTVFAPRAGRIRPTVGNGIKSALCSRVLDERSVL
jgi:hypothetical protein